MKIFAVLTCLCICFYAEGQDNQKPLKWNAWVNHFPPIPKDGPPLIIKGEVLLPSPGYSVELKVAKPQGFNPKILILEVVLTDPPNDKLFPQVITRREVRLKTKYDDYESVQIRTKAKTITVKIKHVH